MRKDPPVISADQSIIDAAMIMLREEIEMLAVVSSDGGVIGVVSPLDVIRKANAPHSRDSTLAIAQGMSENRLTNNQARDGAERRERQP
jgi:predicted transcriptional regulator